MKKTQTMILMGALLLTGIAGYGGSSLHIGVHEGMKGNADTVRVKKVNENTAYTAEELMSEVKAQITDEQSGMRDIRFVVAVKGSYDEENGQGYVPGNYGFKVAINGTEKEVKATKYYNSVYAGEEGYANAISSATGLKSVDEFAGKEGYFYFIALTVENVPSASYDTDISVTPFVEIDGSSLYGTEKVVSVGQFILNRANIRISDSIAHGSVFVASTSVEAGDTVVLNVEPDTDYDIGSVTVNGSVLEPTDGVYAFVAVEGDNTVSADFTYRLGDYAFAAETENHLREGKVTADAIELTNREGELLNVLVKDAGEEIKASTSYTMSAHIQTEASTPVTENMGYGLVPYYVDDNNYFIVYLNYWTSDRPHEVRTVSIDGRIGGQLLHETYGWTESWADGSAWNPINGVDLSVTRSKGTYTVVASGTNDAGETISLSRSVSVNAAIESVSTEKIGVYAHGTGKTVFTSFTAEANPVYRDWTVANRSTSSITTVNEDADGVHLYAESTLIDGTYYDVAVAEFEEVIGETKYTYSANIESSLSVPVDGTNYIGLVPYYVDDDNYLICYVEFSSSTGGYAREAQLTGYIGGTWVGYHDLWMSSGSTGDPLPASFRMEIVRDGTSFQVSVSGGEVARTFDPVIISGASEGTAKLGVYSNWGNAWQVPSTFTDLNAVKASA